MPRSAGSVEGRAIGVMAYTLFAGIEDVAALATARPSPVPQTRRRSTPLRVGRRYPSRDSKNASGSSPDAIRTRLDAVVIIIDSPPPDARSATCGCRDSQVQTMTRDPAKMIPARKAATAVRQGARPEVSVPERVLMARCAWRGRRRDQPLSPEVPSRRRPPIGRLPQPTPHRPLSVPRRLVTILHAPDLPGMRSSRHEP